MKRLEKYKLPIITLAFLSVSSFCSTSVFNANVTIKDVATSIVIALFLMVALAHCLWGQKTHFRFNLIDLCVLVLLALSAVVLKESLLQKHSLLLFYAGLYMGGRLVVKRFSINQAMIYSLSFVIVVHVLFVIAQQMHVFPSFHGFFHNGSTFGTPDALASYLAVLLPIVFVSEQKWLKYGIGILLISVFFFIQARTALLSMWLCAFLWLILNKKCSSRQIAALILIGIVFLSILVYLQPASVFGRFFVWYVAGLMMLEKPLGWGGFAFEKHYPEFQANYLSTHAIPESITPDIVHSPFNECLNVGVTLGMPGLLFYAVLLGLAFYYAIKNQSVLIYSLFVFFVISLSYFPFKIAPLMIIVIPLLASVAADGRTILKQSLNPFVKTSVCTVLLSGVLLLCVKTVRSYLAFKDWQMTAQLSENNAQLDETERLFCELHPKLKTDGRFLITYANFQYQRGHKIEALRLMEESEHYFCDIVSSIELAKMYAAFGMDEKAEKKYDIAINIAPDRFISRYEKILFFVDKADYDKAYDLCRKLYAKPIKKSVYIDPYIIKRKVLKHIKEYERLGTIKIDKHPKTNPYLHE